MLSECVVRFGEARGPWCDCRGGLVLSNSHKESVVISCRAG